MGIPMTDAETYDSVLATFRAKVLRSLSESFTKMISTESFVKNEEMIMDFDAVFDTHGLVEEFIETKRKDWEISKQNLYTEFKGRYFGPHMYCLRVKRLRSIEKCKVPPTCMVPYGGTYSKLDGVWVRVAD